MNEQEVDPITNRTQTKRGTPDLNPWSEALLFAAIILIALALRLHNIERDPLWYDEVSMANLCSDFTLDVFINVVPAPPVYCVFLKYWLLLSHAEWWIRLHAIIMGTMTVGIGFAVGRHLAGARGAVLSGFALAIAPILVFYSRDAKFYSWVTCLGLLVMYSAIRSTSARRPRWWLVAYVVSVVVLLHTHQLSAFFMVAINIAFVAVYVRGAAGLVRWAIAQCCAVAITIPYIVVQGLHIQRIESKIFWALVPEPRSLIVTAYNLITGYATVEWVRLLALLVVVSAAAVYFNHTSRRTRDGTFLILAAILNVVVLYVFSRTAQWSLYVDRYMIGSSAPILIVAACGVAVMRTTILRGIFVCAFLASVSFALSDLYAYRFLPDRKEHEGVSRTFDTRGMAALINRLSRDDDQIWHSWWLAYPQLGWYVLDLPHYLLDVGDMNGRDMTLFGSEAEQRAYGMQAMELDELGTDALERVWLIVPETGAYSFPGLDPGVIPWLEERGTLLRVDRFGGRYTPTTVYLFDCSGSDGVSEPDCPVAYLPMQTGPVQTPAVAPPEAIVTLERTQFDTFNVAESGSYTNIRVENAMRRPAQFSVEVATADAMLAAASFRRDKLADSAWRIRAFRDHHRARISARLETKSDETFVDDTMSITISLEVGEYHVFVERVLNGPNYLSSVMPINLVVGSTTLAVPTERADHAGGWGWVRVGTYSHFDAGDVSLQLRPDADAATGESFAIWSRILFDRLDSSGSLIAENAAPVFHRDIRLEPGASWESPIPSSWIDTNISAIVSERENVAVVRLTPGAGRDVNANSPAP